LRSRNISEDAQEPDTVGRGNEVKLQTGARRLRLDHVAVMKERHAVADERAERDLDAARAELARVLQEIAEVQEEPEWSTTHQALAEQWRAAAEMLLNHAVASAQAQGDAELKQQELMMNHELHQQTLSHNDQKHVQGMKQQDDKHKQGMRQSDTDHKFNLQQQSQKIDTQKKIDTKKIVQAGQTKKSANPRPK